MRSLLVLGVFTLVAWTTADLTNASIVDEPPTCVEEHILYRPGGGHPATLLWEGPEEGARRVSVLFDEAGLPRQYSELKTSVPLETWDRQGIYRLVHLNFETGLGIVEIQDASGQRTQEQREIDDVLTSREFGMPAETIRQVRARCTNL